MPKLAAFEQNAGREYWTFKYKVTDIRDAATTKANYHSERYEYWTDEEILAQKNLEDSIEWRTHEVTGGKQMTAVLDPEKQAYANKCASKRLGHKNNRDAYLGYISGLGMVDEVTQIELTIEDIQYFGL